MVSQATTDALFADFFLYCNVIQVGFSKGAHKLYDPEFTARVPQLLDLVLQSWTKVLGTVLQYSDFSVISLSLLKQCILFEIFLQFSLPPPYTKLKLGKNSGYTRPTLFVGWGEGLDLCELENAPETQKCPKTFELFTNANCCPAVTNGRKSILRSEQGQTTQTGEEHKKRLPSRPKTRRVSEMILIRVYWKAPSMVVVSLEFGPEPLSFTPVPPPLPCWNMLVSNHL